MKPPKAPKEKKTSKEQLASLTHILKQIGTTLNKHKETIVLGALPLLLLTTTLALALQPNKQTIRRLLIDTPFGFCPPIQNREFWRKAQPEVPLTKPPDPKIFAEGMHPLQMNTLLYEGTLSECSLNEGLWISLLTKTIQNTLQSRWSGNQNPNVPDHLDLQSTSLAANLATCLRLLDGKIPENLSQQSKLLINQKIIQPYLKESDRFQQRGATFNFASWVGGADNWSAVCLANIASASLAINDKKTNAEVLEKVHRDIQPYLDSIEKDGYTPGGTRYWNYGFGHFILLAELMYKATNGKINYFENQTVQAAVPFPLKSLIGLGRSPNPEEPSDTPTKHFPFGDNHGYSQLNPWIWNILQNRYQGLPQIPLKTTLTTNPFNNHSLPTMDLLLNPPKPKERIRIKVTRNFPLSGVFSSTSKNKITLVTKGNHNQEETGFLNRPGHNHNDVGTYVVYQNGNYTTGDPGGGTYDNAFGPDRYTRPIESSWGHPVPIVDNQLQRTGKTAAATVLKYEETPTTTEIQYNLQNVYLVEGLTLLTRTFLHNRETGEVLIRDEFESKRPIPFGTTIIQGTKTQKNKPPKVQVQTSRPYQVKETYMDGNDQFASIRRIGIELEPAQSGWIQYSIQPREDETAEK